MKEIQSNNFIGQCSHNLPFDQNYINEKLYLILHGKLPTLVMSNIDPYITFVGFRIISTLLHFQDKCYEYGAEVP